MNTKEMTMATEQASKFEVTLQYKDGSRVDVDYFGTRAWAESTIREVCAYYGATVVGEIRHAGPCPCQECC